MLFRQLFDKCSCTYTYLIAADCGREAIIIDPIIDQMPLYSQLLDELELKLTIALDTHMHADHITATGTLRENCQCSIAMGETTKAGGITSRLKDGDRIQVDGIDIQAIHTPGHTDDSYCYLMKDRVFTGDTLFIRGSGRTDFDDGDPYAAYDSIFNKLLTLSDDTLVYPGHDYKGMTVSTIGEERRFNPRLQINTADEYAAIMNNLNLDQPKLAHIAIPANLKCGLQGMNLPGDEI